MNPLGALHFSQGRIDIFFSTWGFYATFRIGSVLRTPKYAMAKGTSFLGGAGGDRSKMNKQAPVTRCLPGVWESLREILVFLKITRIAALQLF